jgi:PAS domain S-box-containing protein
MRSDNRISGIDIIGDVPWGTHFCQFYQTKEDLMDIIIPYFKAGLEYNEFCWWIISEPLDEEEVKEALKLAIPDINDYLENGQIEIISHADWYVEESILDPHTVSNQMIEKSNKALANGYDGSRYSGNDFCGHNKIFDSSIGKYPVIALCTYTIDNCNVTSIFEIVANHQFALIKREGKWEQIESSCQKNIRECKQYDQALQENKERYKAIFDNSLDGIFFTIPDGTILAANQAACQMYGMTEEEIIRAGRSGMVDESDPRLKSVLEERARTGKFKGELNHKRKGGTIFPSEISSVLFKDWNGLTKGVMIIRDITERKQQEEQTRLHAEELETIMEVVPTPILIGHDPQGHNITGNRMANAFYEAEVGENISASIRKERNFLHKGRELTASELPVQQAALKDIDLHNVELDVLLPSGKWRVITVSASPLHNAEGHVRGSVGAFIDITELKETEDKLKDILNNLEEAVKERTAELEKAYISLKESEERLADAQRIVHVGSYDWNIATNEEYWSDELYHIFRLDPQFKLNHNEFLNHIHPEDREYVSHAINEALNGKQYYIDYRIILPNGEERVIYSQGGVIFDERNTPIRMRGIVQDITESKKAEKALARIEIAQKQEIHHRIKNNLQVISSLLDLQAEKFKGKKNIKDSELLEAFKESQDRVISMALIHEELHKGEETDTLHFSQYIVQLVDNLFLTYRLGNENISLNMNIDEDIFFDIDTAVPLGMIINELVSNSFKYAFVDRDKGEIRIKLRRDENGEYKVKDCMSTNFTLIVSDDGIGIPNDLEIEDIDSLGLQLVTTLVDQLDGELELKRDNGTEFSIRFTVTEKDNQATAP